MVRVNIKFTIHILLVVFAVSCTSNSTEVTVPSNELIRQPSSTTLPTFFLPSSTKIPSTPTEPPSTVKAETRENETKPEQENLNVNEVHEMNITIGDKVLSAELSENSSVDALKAALSEGPITINMRDYGNMEKVGPLGLDLPRNDQQITTEPGDIILYQGSALVIYYAPNSWNFTRLGKITNLTEEELRNILGDGNVTITLSLSQE